MISNLAAVTEAIDRLHADLRHTLDNPPKISCIEAVRDDYVYLTRRDIPSPYVTSGGVDVDCPPLDVQQRLARELCDALASGSFGGRLSWPTCPEHGTALHARRQDDAVLWLCRDVDHYHCVALVGSLGTKTPAEPAPG